MAKNLLKILPAIILIIIILFISYNSYKSTTENSTNPLSIIPRDASLIIQINDISNVNKILDKRIWKQAKSSINEVNVLEEKALYFKNLFNHNKNIFKKNILFNSIHKIGIDKSDILTTININLSETTKKDIASLFGKHINTITYDNEKIYHITTKTKPLYLAFKNDILFYSNTKILVENAIKEASTEENILTDDKFKSIYKTINKSAAINLFINFNAILELGQIYTYSENINNFSEWFALDLKIKDNAIITNGFGKINNTIENYTDLFINQSPTELSITQIIPQSTSKLITIGFDKSKMFLSKRKKLLQKQNKFWSWDKKRKQINNNTGLDYNLLINQISDEVGFFNTSSSQVSDANFTFFKSNNSITASAIIQGIIIPKENYKNFPINYSKDNNITSNLFGDIFKSNTNYFTVIDDYFIFGNSENSIKYIIDNYKAKNTLQNNDYFQKYKIYLSRKGNFTLYINPGKAAKKIKNILKPKYKKNISINNDSLIQFTSFSIQLSNKNDLLLTNINLYYDSDFQEGIQEEWFVQLDTTIKTKPHFVKNHFTKEKMIVVQTNSNMIYAINSEGKIIWEKLIDSEIIGKINSIDVYRNNKYQCLFNTKNEIHIIDRNGEYVDGFPLKLDFNTSLSHSLFDYNNNKKYRIMIISDNNIIHNFNKKGQKVIGWKHQKNKDMISAPLQHFKINKRDYILEETNKSSSRLLALNGSNRVTYNNSNIFNGKKINIDKEGALYAITIDGKLWKGDTNGNSTETTVTKLDSNSILHIYPSNSKEQYFAIANKNIITIINDEFKELYSVEFNEIITQVFSINNKLALSTKNKLFILDKDKIIDGFPIKTDGLFNIDDINNNDKLNIINTKNGALYNYELLN